jgi:hypothetical protein
MVLALASWMALTELDIAHRSLGAFLGKECESMRKATFVNAVQLLPPLARDFGRVAVTDEMCGKPPII